MVSRRSTSVSRLCLFLARGPDKTLIEVLNTPITTVLLVTLNIMVIVPKPLVAFTRGQKACLLFPPDLVVGSNLTLLLIPSPPFESVFIPPTMFCRLVHKTLLYSWGMTSMLTFWSNLERGFPFSNLLWLVFVSILRGKLLFTRWCRGTMGSIPL